MHFVTATTAPRMQIGNGFKVWSISGKTVWEWKANKHLFGIIPFISHPSLPFNPDAEKLVEELSKKSSHSEKSGGSSNVAKNTNVYIPVHKRKGLVGAAVPVKPGSGSSGGDSAFTEKEKKIRTLKKVQTQITVKQKLNFAWIECLFRDLTRPKLLSFFSIYLF